MSERVNETENNAYHSKGSTFVGNPRYTGPAGEVQENPGAITSDSLASESLQNNGSFAANQSGIAASGQPSKGFSGNTTDTSGATILPPTTDARARGAAGNTATMDDYRTPADVAAQDASIRDGGIGGGSNVYDAGLVSGSGSGSGSAGSQQRSAGAAPVAYSAAGGNTENMEPTKKPHGKNVTEGGFDSEGAPNASFTTNIGGENDPGRIAERQFQAGNAKGGFDAGYPGASQGQDASQQNKGGFERLSDDTSA